MQRPIKLYSGTESKTIHFQEVHAKDGARIEHRRVCPKEDREVPYKQIVKGYEVGDGRYVVLGKDNWELAKDLLPPEILRHYKDGEYVNKIVDWPLGIYLWDPPFKAASENLVTCSASLSISCRE